MISRNKRGIFGRIPVPYAGGGMCYNGSMYPAIVTIKYRSLDISYLVNDAQEHRMVEVDFIRLMHTEGGIVAETEREKAALKYVELILAKPTLEEAARAGYLGRNGNIVSTVDRVLDVFGLDDMVQLQSVWSVGDLSWEPLKQDAEVAQKTRGAQRARRTNERQPRSRVCRRCDYSSGLRAIDGDLRRGVPFPAL